MINPVDSALNLASKGFHVFPLAPNTKDQPVFKDYSSKATQDKSVIKNWWAKDPRYNVAIATQKFGDSGALVVVDIDNKSGKNGSEEILRLELEGFEFTKTFSQRTPTGGKHLVYRAKSPVKQGTNVLGKGLDIRSNGGYIVGPGSKINGKYYEIEHDFELSDCPEWIISACGLRAEREIKDFDLSKIDPERARMRASHYLENEAPIAIEGQGGDETTYKVAARVKDFGVRFDVALELMLSLWNERCEPAWDGDSLKDKVKNAYSYGNLTPGELSPEAQFQPIDDLSEKNYLDKINEKYALIFGGQTHSIIEETVDEKGKPKTVFMTEVSFKRLFSPYTVQQEKGKPLSYADIWLDWKKRRQYKGICFWPEKETKDHYNLWRGFAVQPKTYGEASSDAREGFDMFMEHALKNVCQNDNAVFEWLMTYFAHMIQKPYEKPFICLVFKGDKGVGKNTLIDRVGYLVGRHHKVMHDDRVLVSNFNSSMQDALSVVLDEAFWSGNKKAEGKLKGLITEKTMTVERKFLDSVQIDNFIRFTIIGNEDWLVNATKDERRFAVFEVGDAKKQDTKFFSKMRDYMDNRGGCQVLMDYLKNKDLTKCDINTAPKTKGLLNQKLASLTPFEEYYFLCLCEGQIKYSPIDDWPDKLSKEIFYDAFDFFLKKKNFKSRRPSNRTLGKVFGQMCPKTSKKQKLKLEDSWSDAYGLPPIDVCRKDFEKYIGGSINWDEIL